MAAIPVCLVGCASEEPVRDPPREETTRAVDSVAAEWQVSATGAGPLRIGMTMSELQPLLASAPPTPAAGSSCRYVAIAGAPDSVGFMVEQERLARIDVRGGPTATPEGARVGDSEGRIEALYPVLRRAPHKYVDGSYLIVIPGAPADTVHRLVFETDGERVTRYRGGTLPQVEWVEGCS